MILEQSTVIAYTDTFLFMFYASLPVLLVILTLRKVNLLTAGQPGEQQQHMEAME